jgi:hypothetical protein
VDKLTEDEVVEHAEMIHGGAVEDMDVMVTLFNHDKTMTGVVMSAVNRVICPGTALNRCDDTARVTPMLQHKMLGQIKLVALRSNTSRVSYIFRSFRAFFVSSHIVSLIRLPICPFRNQGQTSLDRRNHKCPCRRFQDFLG